MRDIKTYKKGEHFIKVLDGYKKSLYRVVTTWDKKEKDLRLLCYASGSGALSFSWDYDGVAETFPILKEDVQVYLNEIEPRLKKDYWLLKINDNWQLVHKVKRKDKETLLLKVKGRYKEVRYKHTNPKVDAWFNCYSFDAFMHSEILGKDIKIKNISMLGNIRYFLEHEKAITEALNRGA